MNLAEAVAALPATSEAIGLMLIETGVRGLPNAANQCPLAVWLQRQTGEEVTVGYQRAETDGTVVVLPLAVGNFVHQFDSGRDPRWEVLRSNPA